MEVMNSRRTASIFVVEDDTEDVELVWRSFRRLNTACDITHLRDGEELIQTMESCLLSHESELPHLILLDLNMPILNGRDTLAKVKSDSRFCRIPVIVLTSSNAKEDVDEAYTLGANSVISKPFTLQDLTDTVNIIEQYWLNLVQLPNSA